MTEVLPPTAPQVAAPAPQRLEGEQLEEAVMKQIDYYFSRQNLATDAYLVSQMDSDMWVPISTIAGFKKVHILTHDVDFIVRVMSKSSNVVVDTTRMAIKPSWKLQRNTIILRDIPSDAPEEEVRQLFEGKFPITAVHSDVGDTWFVTLETEDTALDAFMHLRNVTFRDKAVKARMKAEHLLKSSTVPQPYTQPYVMDPAYQQYRAYAAQYAPRVPYQPQFWEGQPEQGKGERSGRPYRGNRRGGQGAHGAQAGAGQTQGAPTQGGRPRGNSHGQGQAPFKGEGAAPSGGKGRVRKGKKNAEAKPVTTNGIHPAPSVIVPQLNQQHFPSLPSPSGRISKASFKSGYTADFRRFTKDDILRIINTVQDVNTRPSTVIVAEPGVVEAKPNTNLEITSVPAVPEPPVLEALEPEVAPASPVVAAPGVAVREWPAEKKASPAPTAAPTPKKEAPAPAAAAAATAAAPAPAPAVASPAAQQPALRKSAEQEKPATNSPSLSASAEALRSPSYADIALGAARTNSPPIASAKSPALGSASPSPSTLSLAAAAPPAPSTTALEGKQ